ncbi:hypothetical protein [Microbacterium sp. p3-SID336]|uniref:hypothetical protein n=1 Tax=Microbacterium sp. p3-SID336 TaxID=2916212 RepID=UPI0021A4D840|nr:hypothetical protein [Microbacterium sp. p3-SID336]MCT1478300.1 hypothetical protein [Microbacterium sp. p3-SID336]
MCQLKSEGPRCATHAPALYLYAENRCSVYARILADDSVLTPEEQASFKELSAKAVLDAKEKNRLSELQRIQANGSKLSETEKDNYEKNRASFLKLSRDVDLNAVAGGAMSVRQLHAARVDVLRAVTRDPSFKSRPDHRLITEALADIDRDPENFGKLSRDLERTADELVESGAVADLKPTVKLGNGRIYPVDANRLENLKFLANRYYEVRGQSPVAADKKQRDAYGVVTRLRVNNPEAFKTMCDLDATEEEIAELPPEYVQLRTSAHFTKVLALAHHYDTKQFASGIIAAEAKVHSPTNYKNNPDRDVYDEYIAALPSVPHVDGVECGWADETKFGSMRKRLTRDEALLRVGKYAQLIEDYNGMFTTTPPTVALPMPGAPKKNMNPREAELHAAASLPRGTSPSKKTEPSLRPELLTGKGGVSPSDAKARATVKTSTSTDEPVTTPKSTVRASIRSDAQSTPAPTVKAAPSATKPSPLPSPLPLPFPDKQSSAPMKTTSVEVPLSAVTSVKESKPLLPPADTAKEKVTEGSITDFINKILRPKRRH